MEKLALSVSLETVIAETEECLKKGRAVLLVGRTSCQYVRSVNMKNGCFNGYAMYAGMSNRTIKIIRKYFERKYPDVVVESGKGFVKLYREA